MLKAYMATMERIHIRTWLMHGCLLGWWWNTQIMPWDTDIDIMVDELGIQELGGWWNMSVHHFSPTDLEPTAAPTAQDKGPEDTRLRDEIKTTGKKYLLEVNPHYANTSTHDTLNVIDARWIDTATGLFIDITTLHVQPSLGASSSSADDDDDTELYTKDQHAYSSSQMFPLRTTTFEGVAVHVPFDYEGILLDEYGPRAITHTWYRGWRFDASRLEWVFDDVEKEEAKGTKEVGKDGGRGYKVRIGERDAR
jgi:hypothetical protein